MYWNSALRSLGAFLLLVGVGARGAHAGDGAIVDGKLNLSVLFTYPEDDPSAWRPMFEEANRLLFNATNGQLQLGRIEVHNCGLDKPDIDIWILDGNSGAFANVLGLGGDGHVFLSQTHESSSGNALGQFGLVHELGHYAFGLYDEYKGEAVPLGLAARSEQVVEVPNQFCTTEDDRIACVMDGGTTVAPNHLRTEFCTHAEGELGTAHNDGVVVGDERFVNAQEVYNLESCWETIGRIAGLELPTVVDTVPPAGLEPIEWEVLNDLGYLVIAADRSASMFTPSEDSPIRLAQGVAGRIVDLIRAEKTLVDDDGSEETLPGEYLGIVSFGPDADIAFPLQEILDEETRDRAREVVANLPPNHLDLEATDLGAALQTSFDQIAAQSEVPACSESIVLLSDGRNTTGEDLSPLLGVIAERGVEVYAVGVGENVDSDLLDGVAAATGGQFFRATSAEDLPGIFTAIAAAVRSDGIIFAGNDSTNGDGELLPLLIDSLAEEVTVICTWAGGLLDIELVSPTGDVITIESAESREDVEAARGPGFLFIRVVRPEAGEWVASIEPAEVEEQLFYDFTVLGGDREIVVEAKAGRTFFDALPGPVRLSVDVVANAPVAGAMVSGTVLRPDGTVVPLELLDDGNPARDDRWADDGTYTTLFRDWTTDGTYLFEFQAVNVDGTGPDPDLPFVEDGADPPGTVPPFVRETSLEIVLDTGLWTVPATLQGSFGADLRVPGAPLTVSVELDGPQTAAEIDATSIRLNGGIAPLAGSVQLGDRDANGVVDLTATFAADDLAMRSGIGAELPIRVSGVVGAGQTFEVSGTAAVIQPEGDADVVLSANPLLLGTVAELAWPEAAQDPIEYRGYLSRDDGATWTEIFAGTDMPRAAWTVAGLPTSDARILVEARTPERVVTHHVSAEFAIEGDPSAVPDVTALLGRVEVRPHPVRDGGATLRFALADAGSVELAIYDVNGRRIRSLVSGPVTAGLHEVPWDGRDADGNELSSGVYLYVLQTQEGRREGRITMLK